MEKVSRTPVIWGLICFALVYQTFPSDIFYSWLYYYQFQGYYSQLVVQWILQLTPPLVPLICFIVFYRQQITHKSGVLLLPVLLWLASKFIIAVIIYGFALKVGSIDLIADNLSVIIERIYTFEWFLKQSIYAITIVICSYAFWRESDTHRIKRQSNVFE